MRWANHKIVTASLVYCTTGKLIPALLAGAGSLFPDLAELGIIPHRTLTHWPYPYLALFFVACAWEVFNPSWPCYLLLFLVMGALLHIGEDFLSYSGVPLGVRWDRGYFSARLFETGSRREDGVVLLLVAFSCTVSWYQGTFSLNYLLGEVKDLVAVASHAVRTLHGG
jgi:inner membrane protein